MIEYTDIFISTLFSTLTRYNNATSEAQKQAVLSRQTVRGIKFAIQFVGSLGSRIMTESEMKHALRLTYFRGQDMPVFKR